MRTLRREGQRAQDPGQSAAFRTTGGVVATRRTFIQSGAALSAVSLTGGFASVPAQALAGGRAMPALDLFIFDDRFAAAREIARAQHAPAALRFTGDPTRLWQRTLEPRWRAAPMALGGATTAHGLFVFETLAADRRMRLVHRQDLPADADGEALAFWILAPRASARAV